MLVSVSTFLSKVETVSLPGPPSRASATASWAKKVSLSSPPERLSAAVPPMRVSLPAAVEGGADRDVGEGDRVLARVGVHNDRRDRGGGGVEGAVGAAIQIDGKRVPDKSYGNVVVPGRAGDGEDAGVEGGGEEAVRL